jgi:hypothetical protein
MRHNTGITARRVTDEADRRRVIEVLTATYQLEKDWISDPAEQIPPDDLTRGRCRLVRPYARRPSGRCSTRFVRPVLRSVRRL